MIKLQMVPEGPDEIIRWYGVPGRVEGKRFVADREWIAENLKYFKLSFPLRQSWDYKQIQGFYIHKKVGPAMIDALEEVRNVYGMAYMRLKALDYWGGCHNPRLKRGSREPSTHAFAISIDYCPDLGKMGDPSRMPWHIVEAFIKRGFEWGGLWREPDGMHFQACTMY